MDSSGSGYWVCSNCGNHNLRQLSRCVNCDSISSPSPLAHHQSARRGIQSSPSPSRTSRLTAADMASPKSRMVTQHATSMLNDLDGKNTIISRLEQHLHAMVEQQSRQRHAHDQEVEAVQAHLRQVTDDHRSLMVEYRRTVTDLASKQAEVALLGAEVTALRDKLSNEVQRRYDESNAHMTELDAKSRHIRALKEQVAQLEDSLRLSSDRIPARRAEDGILPAASDDSRKLQLKLTELSSQNDELSATVQRLSLDLESSRQMISSMKEQYAESLKKVVRDAVCANESAVLNVTAELHKIREASENSATSDKKNLERRIQELVEKTAVLEEQLTWQTERATQLERAVKAAQEERDRVAIEAADTQLELERTFTRERTQLNGEIERFKASLRDATTRDSILPAPPSTANITHTAAATRSQQQQIISSADIEEMNRAVAESMGSPTPRIRDLTLERALSQTTARLSQSDSELGQIRGQLATQNGLIERLQEELREARSAPSHVENGSVGATATDLEACKAIHASEVAQLNEKIRLLTDEAEQLEDSLRTTQFELQRSKPDAALMQRLKEDLNAALSRASDKEDLLFEKEELLKEEQRKIVEITNQLTSEKKALEATIAKLREDLDAANIALEDAEQATRRTMFQQYQQEENVM